MAQPAGSGRTPAAFLAEAEVLNWLAATVRRLDRLLSKFAQTTREPLLLEPLLPLPRQDTFHWNVLADAFVPPAPDLPHPPAADLLDPPHDLPREPAEVPGRAEASPHSLPCEVAGGSTTTGGCTGGGCRTGGCIAGGDRATGGFTTGGCTGGHTGGGDTGSNHSTGGFTSGSNAGGDYTTGGFTTGGCAGGHTGGGNTGDNHSTGSNTDGDYTNGFLPSSGGNGASPFDLEQGGSNDPGVAAAVGSFFGPGGGGGKGTFAEGLAELSLDTEKHPEQSYDTGAVKRTEKIPDTEKHTEQENAMPKKKAVAKRRKKKKQEKCKKEHNNDSNNGDDTNSHSHSHSNTNDQQKTINNQQPTTNNLQPTTNQLPTTSNQQPTTYYQLPTCNQQPTTNTKQPTTNNQQPTTNSQQPTTDNHQQTTNNQPTSNNQPTTNNQHSTTTKRETAEPNKVAEQPEQEGYFFGLIREVVGFHPRLANIGEDTFCLLHHEVVRLAKRRAVAEGEEVCDVVLARIGWEVISKYWMKADLDSSVALATREKWSKYTDLLATVTREAYMDLEEMTFLADLGDKMTFD